MLEIMCWVGLGLFTIWGILGSIASAREARHLSQITKIRRDWLRELDGRK